MRKTLGESLKFNRFRGITEKLGSIVGFMFLSFVIGGCDDDSKFPVPLPAVRTVAFGDSSTAGPAERDYVDFLRESLGASPEMFANAGDSGETSAEGAERLGSLISRGIFPNAQVLLYWEGAKDLIEFIKERDPLLLFSPDDAGYPFSSSLSAKLSEIQSRIESAIQSGQGAGWQVFVATYFFLEGGSLNCDPLLLDLLLPGQAVHANQYVVKLNDAIRSAAERQGAFLVDVESIADALMADRDNYFDCNHLSAQGNGLVAGVFLKAMKVQGLGG